jgi:anti-sigma factor RsiW
MTHQDAVNGDLADAYVAGTLPAPERDAFEEHLFACEDCFATLQATERLRAGVRQLAASGELTTLQNAAPPLTMPQPGFRLPRSAGWLAAAATIVLALGSGWTLQQRNANLRTELDAAQGRAADLQRSLEQASNAALVPSPVAAEGNLPVAILQTTRSVDPPATLTITGSSRLVVWLDDAPVREAEVAELIVEDATGKIVSRIGGLRRNDQNAVVAAFPVAEIATGTQTLRLVVQNQERATYRLQIVR